MEISQIGHDEVRTTCRESIGVTGTVHSDHETEATPAPGLDPGERVLHHSGMDWLHCETSRRFEEE